MSANRSLVVAAAAALLGAPSVFAQLPSAASGGADSAALGGALYDDPCVNGQAGLTSQDYPDQPCLNARTLDDFTVPEGVIWRVDGFRVEGNYSTVPQPPTCPEAYFFEIYPDTGSGADCGRTLGIWVVPPGAEGLTDGPNCRGADFGAVTYCPAGGTGLYLPAGRYWLSAGVRMPFAPCGNWLWVGSTSPQQHGLSPVFDDRGCRDIPACIPWSNLGVDQDQAFTIYGLEIGIDFCGVRAGNVNTGDGSPPVDVLRIDGSVGDSCRELVVTANQTVTINVASAPSIGGRGQWALWTYDGNTRPQDIVDLVLQSGSGGTYRLGYGARCLPVNNTGSPGSCPCPINYPEGRTSKGLGGGKATLLCLNRKPGYPKSPTSWEQSFPNGEFTLGGLVLDFNSVNSPAKDVAISNWIVVGSL